MTLSILYIFLFLENKKNSTDEDARQAMMRDREKINEVQVRLLLSSRSEMLKVIEMARQQSLLALQNAGAVPAVVAAAAPKVAAPAVAPIVNPQPPIITASSLQNILANQLGPAPSFLAYQQQAGITLQETNIPQNISLKNDQKDADDISNRGQRSDSRERKHSSDRTERDDRSSSSRRRRDRSRSRERESSNRYRSSGRDRESSRRDRPRSRSRDRSKERDRSRDRNRRGSSRSRRSSKERNGSDNRGSSRHEGYSRNDPRHNVNTNRAVDESTKLKTSAVSPWSIPPSNVYQTNYNNPTLSQLQNAATLNPFVTAVAANAFGSANSSIHNSPNAYTTINQSKQQVTVANTAVESVLPSLQNYSSSLPSTNNTTTNNYSVNPFNSTNALQNPYTIANTHSASTCSNSPDLNSKASTINQAQSNTMFPGLFLNQASEDTKKPNDLQQVTQEPIAFANTNPYAQIYPNLFAQAATLGGANKINSSVDTSNKGEFKRHNIKETSCIKISQMCPTTTYSDLRKFFSGLFIPHNGIKILCDDAGNRLGEAYVQFSRISNAEKALERSGGLLKEKHVTVDLVPPSVFENAIDGIVRNSSHGRNQNNFRERQQRNDNENLGNSFSAGAAGGSHSNPFNNAVPQGPFSVLYVVDLPSLTTEQDVMRIFSAFSIYDILLIPNPENRRELVAYVKFSRQEEARAAMDEKRRHMIGNRQVRVRPVTDEEMEKAKERVRLANEQLQKEEEAERESQRNAAAEEMLTKEESSNANDVLNQQSQIPSIFDLQTINPSDPRTNHTDSEINISSSEVNNCHPNNFNPLNELRFVILKNCAYKTHINDLGQMFMSKNYHLKHIEPLCNEKGKPSGEFIVEFTNAPDAERATQQLNNTQFGQRTLKVYPISPQEIANRLGTMFMNYVPGGRGPTAHEIIRCLAMEGGAMRAGRNQGNNFNRNQFNRNQQENSNIGSEEYNEHYDGKNDHEEENEHEEVDEDGNEQQGDEDLEESNQDVEILDDNDVEEIIDNDDAENPHEDDDDNRRNNNGYNYKRNLGGSRRNNNNFISNKFNRPGCVLSLSNVPYKATIQDIMQFFTGYRLDPDDVIRRYNDNGTPTGDARVAFPNPQIARRAFNSRKRHRIFNRQIYLDIN